MCENIFTLIDEKPVYEQDYKVINNDFKKDEFFTIVMQGPIKYEDDFTLETLKIYKKNYKNCPIIVSTWDYEKEETLRAIEKFGCIVLRNGIPDVKCFDFTNYQIKSTQAGLKKAREIGSEYVLKTRCDQRMYENHVNQYLFNLLRTFPLDESIKNQKQRLVALSLNTFKYRLYDISDMFLFGTMDDVENFWSMDYERREVFPQFETVRDFALLLPCEIGFTVKYLKKIGENLDFTLKNSWEMYKKYFCVIDTNTVGLHWPKHSNKVFRWRNFFGEQDLLEELTFKEWLNLYSNFDNVIPNEEIINRRYDSITPINFKGIPKTKNSTKKKIKKFFINFIPDKKLRKQLREKNGIA